MDVSGLQAPTSVLAGYVQATLASDGTAHIAYVPGSRFWRQGIGSAAVRGMLRELESTYGARSFVATLKKRNHRSLALSRSLGFERSRSEESDEVVMHESASTVPAVLQ